MSRVGVCPVCKSELKIKKIFFQKIKYCPVCMELKKKDKTQL